MDLSLISKNFDEYKQAVVGYSAVAGRKNHQGNLVLDLLVQEINNLVVQNVPVYTQLLQLGLLKIEK